MLKYLLLLLAVFSLNVLAQDKQYVDLGAKIIQIEDKNILAVEFQNEKDWHTYWKNPGDAGLEIKLKFNLDGKEINLKDYAWPAPKRYIEQGNMWAYGYGGKYSLFYDIPEDLKNKEFTITGEWLVCKDICIPGTRTIKLDIDENLNAQNNTFISDTDLYESFNFLPKLVESTQVKFFLSKGKKPNQLSLKYMIENADFDKIDKKKNIVTPYHAFPFDYKHEEVYLDHENKIIYGHTLIDWDGIFEDPVWPMPEDGIFKKPIKAKFLIQYPKGVAHIYEHEFKQFTLGSTDTLDKLFASLPKLGEEKKESKSESKAAEEESILTYFFFAFIGGLILNLMPCVLPVISLKLFGLIVHSDESNKQIFRHNLFYTLGVLFSFGVLATIVTALKESGEQIGWGFQLQSPEFVFFMLLLIFIMALNMLGLFEFYTPGGKRLGNLQIKTGVYGDFVNGVLATILSTPCSAPFLGSALPFAFASSTVNTYLIFMGVGIGLSFPFIITGIFPSLVKALPKPGAWMERLKNFLGFTMLLTAIWLYDVFATLIDISLHGIYIQALLAFLFFAFYYRKHISKNLIMNIVVFTLPVANFIYLKSNDAFEVVSNVQQIKSTGKVDWKPWTPESMASAQTAKRYTFINFTAAWCLTCKVNKKIVLNSDDFSELVKEKKINLLEGDWTKRDDDITQFLRKYNIAGVPAYFIVKPDGSVVSLGETITINKIKENL